MNDFRCLPCLDRLADHYDSQLGHEMSCSVGDLCSPVPIGERLYHRAFQVQYHGGSWSLNVYRAQCGAEALTRGGRGRQPCLTCFPNHPELLQVWREEHGLQ